MMMHLVLLLNALTPLPAIDSLEQYRAAAIAKLEDAKQELEKLALVCGRSCS